jgi:hypothetical protein
MLAIFRVVAVALASARSPSPSSVIGMALKLGPPRASGMAVQMGLFQWYQDAGMVFDCCPPQ